MIDWKEYSELNRMWETRGARFGAHDRLTKTNIWTNYGIATGSAWIVVLSLISIIASGGSGDAFTVNIISLYCILFSVIIIFISLIEGGKNLTHRAEQMHACAKEISLVYHAAEAAVRMSPSQRADLNDFVRQYDIIVNKYDSNHDLLDFNYFKCINTDAYNIDAWSRLATYAKRSCRIYGVFFMMLVALPAVLGVISLYANQEFGAGSSELSDNQPPLDG